MALLEEIAKDVYISRNKIDTANFIKLIEEASKAYPFVQLETRPYLGMNLPLNFNVQDTSACINLRYEVLKILMPSVIEYVNKNNLEHMFHKKEIMVFFKLLPGQGMEPHVDDMNKESNHFMCLLYINSDFEGGELIFHESDLTYKPNDGDIIFFKASLSHEVKPVKNGVRYNIAYGLIDEKTLI